MLPSDPRAVHTGELPERSHTAILAALNLTAPDPVRTAAAAETLTRLLAWLAFDGNRCRREFKLQQVRGGNWLVALTEDHVDAAWSSKTDPIDALAHALTVAEAADDLAMTDGDRDTRAPECAEAE